MQYEKYIAELHSENALIRDRMTWLLTSQTILFAAYGLIASARTREAHDFAIILIFTGLITTIVLFMGVLGALLAAAYWRAEVRALQLAVDSLPRYLDVRLPYVLGHGAAFLLPYCYIGAWGFTGMTVGAIPEGLRVVCCAVTIVAVISMPLIATWIVRIDAAWRPMTKAKGP